MCFSAEASFGLGAGLVVAGSYCAWRARNRTPAYLPLALTPLLFGVQQLCEGLVWMGLQRDDPALVQSAALGFLFFALALWPAWLPLCAAVAEPRPTLRRLWGLLAVLGLVWFPLLYLSILREPARYLTVQVEHHSLAYAYFEIPLMLAVPRPVLQVLYVLMGGVALVASSDPVTRRFGILLGLAALVSRLVFVYAFASVWCFFAAGMALYLCHAVVHASDRSSRSGEIG